MCLSTRVWHAMGGAIKRGAKVFLIFILSCNLRLFSLSYLYYSRIIPYSFDCLLFSKLCQHNMSRPKGESSIGSQIFSSLPQGSLRLIQECRHLEEKLSCQGCTDSLLNSQSSLREKKREILKTDWDSYITEGNMAIAAQIAVNALWVKLWDMALDYGPRGTECLQAYYH